MKLNVFQCSEVCEQEKVIFTYVNILDKMACRTLDHSEIHSTIAIMKHRNPQTKYNKYRL